MLKILIALFTLVACLQPAFALTLKISQYFDSPNGVFKKGSSIVIEKNEITKIHTSHTKVKYDLDLSRYYVLPGLIDAHNHLLLLDKSFGQNFSDEMIKPYNTIPELRIKQAVQTGQQILEMGITTTKDLGNSGLAVDLLLNNYIQKNNILFPRFISSGPGIATVAGQFKVTTRESSVANEYIIIKSERDIDDILKDNLFQNREILKIYIDNRPGEGEMSEALACAITSKAHALHMTVSAHATEAATIKRAVKCSVDSIEHGYMADEETLREMSRKKITLVATDMLQSTFGKLLNEADKNKIPLTMWSRKFYSEFIPKRIKIALKLNVPMAFGSDFYYDVSALGLSQGAAIRQTLYSYKESGIKEKTILQMATLNSAKLLGKSLEGKLGVIAPGYYADMVVVRKNPLLNIKNLEDVLLVIKNGEIVFRKPL